MSLTVAQHIFQVPYNVKIANQAFFSEQYLEEFGFHSSGDKERDRVAMSERRSVYIPIAGMVIHHSEGHTVELVRPEDSVEIYQQLKAHLENWRILLENTINTPDAPLEDLKKMDNFAAGLYPIATRFTEQTHAKNSIMNDTVRLFTRGAIIDPNVKPQIVFGGHKALSDAISRASFSVAQRRN